MNISLVELTPEQVVGLNKSAIEQAHLWDKRCKQQHAVRDLNGLKGCIGGIFQQLMGRGYVHLPLEKMAGLILYRVAQGQFFIDGNKRTALLSTIVFLGNNAHRLRVERGAVNDLLTGFASSGGAPKYSEAQSIQFIFDNILPNLQP